MLLGFPKVFQHAEPKRLAPRRAMRDNSAQCEMEYEEMSHMSYRFKMEIETLESYAQVMKDTSETNKEDAEKFWRELKTLTPRLQDVELSLTAKIQEVIELEHKI